MTQAYDESDLPRLHEVAVQAAVRWALNGNPELINLSENATYAVGEQHILRVGRPGYSTAQEIESELAWVDALRDVVTTAPVISAPTGENVIEVADRPCVVFGRLPGGEPSEDDLPKAFERLGAITQRLHAHARDWTAPPGFRRRTWDERTTIGDRPHWGRWEDGMGVGPAEAELLGRLRDELITRLHAYGKSRARFE